MGIERTVADAIASPALGPASALMHFRRPTLTFMASSPHWGRPSVACDGGRPVGCGCQRGDAQVKRLWVESVAADLCGAPMNVFDRFH